MSQICSFNLNSFIILSRAFSSLLARSVSEGRPSLTLRASRRCVPDAQEIEDARAVRVHRLLLGKDCHSRLAALAETDAAPGPGAEVVENHHVLAVGLSFAQRLQAERDADHPAEAGDAGVTPRQGHRADHLSDAHGRPAPPARTPPPAGRPAPTDTAAA